MDFYYETIREIYDELNQVDDEVDEIETPETEVKQSSDSDLGFDEF